MKKTVFDKIMENALKEDDASELLSTCMSGNPSASHRVPLRFRIIALGFIQKMTLEELNNKLLQMGCARLYARSTMDASLIFAFSKGLDYEEWKRLESECAAMRDCVRDPYFQTGSVTFTELKAYVEDNSDKKGLELSTRRLTVMMEENTIHAALSNQDFHSFILENIASYTSVREKSRYYFCKYLMTFLETRMNQYKTSVTIGFNQAESLERLSVLKGITKLKRKKMTPEEAMAVLEESAISCGTVYDEYNDYFFEYASLDWMEILLEHYGNIDQLPLNKRKRLVMALRHYDSKYKKLSDDAVLESVKKEMDSRERELDELYREDGGDNLPLKNRSGEKAVRNYIKGVVDIDRTTLICFLIYFAAESVLPEHMMMNAIRLSAILKECGFATLQEDDDFDFFIIQYLQSPDPVSLLMEEVTRYALSEENFYLYQSFKLSKSYDDEFSHVVR